MSKSLKTLHYASLSLGFLSAVAVIFNLIIFSILFPQVTQLMESQPHWETYGVVAAINIIILAFFQLISVITLLSHLIIHRKTSVLVVLAVVTGILSGLMIMGDISLLSDIGSEYEVGWQTRGEWLILFTSYGLHVISLLLGLLALFKNLSQKEHPGEIPFQDEVLFQSLQSSGVICGALGLVGVVSALASNLSLWMMERIAVILSLIILAPYLVTLVIWLFRRRLAQVSSTLDEKQNQDLAASGLRTLLASLFAGMILYGLQLSPLAREAWQVLWFPLQAFLSLAIFSGLSLRYAK